MTQPLPALAHKVKIPSPTSPTPSPPDSRACALLRAAYDAGLITPEGRVTLNRHALAEALGRGLEVRARRAERNAKLAIKRSQAKQAQVSPVHAQA